MELGSAVARRRAAIALALLLVVAAGAVAAAVLMDSGASTEPLEAVPADVDYVGTLQPDEMHRDKQVAATSRRSLRFQESVAFYDGPPFTASFAVSADTPLEPTAAEWVTYYGRTNGSSYDARIVRANWSAQSLVSAVEERRNVSLSPDEYRGQFFHHGGGYAVAVLPNDTYVVGNETAVRDAVDVAEGDEDEAESLDGPLREEYEATRDGYVRFAYRFRPSNVPDYQFVGESVRRIEYVSSAYYRNASATSGDGGPGTDDGGGAGSDGAAEERVGVAISLTVDDQQGARSVESILNAGMTFYRIETNNATLRRELERIQFDRGGDEVRINYESSPDGYRVLIRGLIENEPEEES
jgi:hypothetical protein